MRRKRGELVAMRAEGKSGKFRDFLRRALGEFGMGLESCAHRGSANGEVVETLKNLLQTSDITIEQAGPAAELLANGQRHSVLQVGAANFHHVVEFLGLGSDCIAH